MGTRVKAHKSKRGSRTVMVKEHTKKRKFRSIKSSFLDRVSEDGKCGYIVTIMGREYPYPFLPSDKVGGVIAGGGKYYNKKIRGKYF